MNKYLNSSQARIPFPVGYNNFHKDKSINFQLNRWYSLGYWTKVEAEGAGKKVHDLSDWKPALIEVAEQLEKENRLLAAAIAIRAAEFFTHPQDPDKAGLYDRFIEGFYTAVPGDQFERLAIPYQGGEMPALRFTPHEKKATIVLHGGLDSFVEELYTTALYIVDAGYELILFDGPGQGGAFRKSNLTMTHEWEHPVSAVLDYLDLHDVTLVGLSMGGYLALRAAAFEKRIARVVAFDIFIYDQHGSGLQGAVYRLFIKYPGLYNWVARTAMKRSVSANHVISQWMAITGSSTPADWNALVQNYSVSDIADQVQQDVFLMAGADDHMIPLKEYEKNRQGLLNARSVTGRIFTQEEDAQNHCQVGNIQLALDEILAWIDTVA